MYLILMTQGVDDFFRTSDDIFEPKIESETFQLFAGNRRDPVFELFGPGVFHYFDTHALFEDILAVIYDYTTKQFVILSGQTSECLR